MIALYSRELGKTGIKISPLGIGCWAIGGPFYQGKTVLGWGKVNDNDSIKAIYRAISMGVNFIDTADVYGAGHSEVVLGKALHGIRHKVVLATKFGHTFDEVSKQKLGIDTSPEYIQRACEASLKRLNTDYIDLYQFHHAMCDPQRAKVVRDKLEDLVSQGKILTYGWSTRTTDRAKIFSEGKNCVAIQHPMSVLDDNNLMLKLCERYNLASINRAPLAMGLLTGKFDRNTILPANDVRGINGLKLDYFSEGRAKKSYLRKIKLLENILMSDGRSLSQGSIAWLWAKSKNTIPIPGFKNINQIEENCGAMKFGALGEEHMVLIDNIARSIIE